MQGPNNVVNTLMISYKAAGPAKIGDPTSPINVQECPETKLPYKYNHDSSELEEASPILPPMFSSSLKLLSVPSLE